MSTKLEQENSNYNLSKDMIGAVRYDGSFESVNPAWTKTLGWTERELRGRSWFDLVHPDDQEATITVGNLLKQGEMVQLFENRYRNKNGTYHWLAWNALSLTVHNLILLVSRDISAWKQAERYHCELIQKLESKNQEMENLLQIVAHDLCTPLINISGYMSLLIAESQKIVNGYREHRLDGFQVICDSIDQHVGAYSLIINKSILKMELILKNVGYLIKLGHIDFSHHWLAMNILIQEVLDNMRHQINQCKAQIRVDPLPDVNGDANWLQQVFSNLIGNAIKYSHPERPPAIHIYGSQQDHWNSYFVQDNGLGISEPHISKIFDIFYRIESDDKMPGSGLGLTLTRLIVERHGGSIEVESKLGEGSTFIVSLPHKQW